MSDKPEMTMVEMSYLEWAGERIVNAALFARLMLASPKERLEYCEANGLMPEVGKNGKYPTEACVDAYWRKVIATEFLKDEKR